MKKRLYIILFTSLIIFTSAIAQELKKGKNMNNPFGVLEFLHWNHAWNSYKYPDKKSLKKVVTLMKKAGVGWVRMDFLWQDIEPKQAEFNFTKYDYIVELLTKNNIKILGVLNYSADWASSSRAWNCPPSDNELFVNYAVKVVSRYKDQVKHWEVWNEPDSSTYWTDQDGLKSYSILLKDVYTALKKIDPECKILNGGLANGIASVNKLYDNGAKDYFDILNIHIFESPLHQGAIDRIKAYPLLAYKIMSRNGDASKKIWVTEIGSPGVKTGLETGNWWLGENPDEQEQAAWARDIYTAMLKEEAVETIFWAYFRDCKGHWGNGVDYFGLVRWDFSEKPAFRAYQDCSKDWQKRNK